jgi:hypothetical protein
MDLDLENVIRRAFGEALAGGWEQLGQTVFAVQAVQLARPDMTTSEALAAVKLVQQESPPVSTSTAPPPSS